MLAQRRLLSVLQPAIELVAVHLGVELDAEMASDGEGLHPELVGGEHRRRRRDHAAIAVKLKPRPGADDLGGGGVDVHPPDLVAPRRLHPATECCAQRLRTEADTEDGDALRFGPAQPVKLVFDPRSDGGAVIDRPRGPEDDDGVDAGQCREDGIGADLVHLQVRSPPAQALTHEAGIVLFVVADNDHPHVDSSRLHRREPRDAIALRPRRGRARGRVGRPGRRTTGPSEGG